MNALAQAQFEQQDEAGTALALPANLQNFVDGRDKAIALWLQSYDTLHANIAEATKVSVGGNIGLAMPFDRNGTSQITAAFLGNERGTFERKITHETDRRCWTHLMEHLRFDELLDRQAREEFHDSLKGDPPVFDVDTIKATFGHIWVNRRDIYLRGIANVFMKMDRRFRSHDAFGIGNRLIIERAMNADSWGGWQNYNRRDTLHDVERIFRELDGLGPIGMNMAIGIVHQVEETKRREALPHLVKGDYFRVRVFKNGNLHLWFERKDLLAEINKLLLEYYKPVEGDVGEGPSYEAGPLYHQTPAKHFGAFNTSAEIADLVASHAGISEGMTVLEPSAGTGMLAKAARARGGKVTCVEIQAGLGHELNVLHGFRDVYERDFLRCEPKNWPEFDRIIMNPPFDRGRDCDHVRHAYQFLRPGGVLVAIMSARAEFGTDARHKALHALLPKDQWKFDRCWTDLSEKSFAHAGTNVNTVMLRIEKPRG
jgi:predicted RNA methylase